MRGIVAMYFSLETNLKKVLFFPESYIIAFIMSVWREEDIKRKLIGNNLLKTNLFGKTIGTGKYH